MNETFRNGVDKCVTENETFEVLYVCDVSDVGSTVQLSNGNTDNFLLGCVLLATKIVKKPVILFISVLEKAIRK